MVHPKYPANILATGQGVLAGGGARPPVARGCEDLRTTPWDCLVRHIYHLVPGPSQNKTNFMDATGLTNVHHFSPNDIDSLTSQVPRCPSKCQWLTQYVSTGRTEWRRSISFDEIFRKPTVLYSLAVGPLGRSRDSFRGRQESCPSPWVSIAFGDISDWAI